MLKLNIQGSGVIKHGEHGTIKTESPTVFKYVQQELNPITKKMQKATDQWRKKSVIVVEVLNH